MAYILGQKHFDAIENDNEYMTYITDTEVRDYDSSSSSQLFIDSCLYINGTTFSVSNTYYIHVKIKRENVINKTFNIKLINYDGQVDISQVVKTFKVEAGDGLYDLSFTFNPLSNNFNCILFELQRQALDSTKPEIAYIELSQINNRIELLNSNIDTIVKIGVQASPHFQMCINGEDIRTSMSGVWELRNNVVSINSFSVVAGSTSVKIDEAVADQVDSGTGSITCCDCDEYDDKIRQINAYTVDFVYKNKEV